MQTFFVIHSGQYPYHKSLLPLFLERAAQYGDCQVLDMADDHKSLHEKYDVLEQNGCDLLISFDCAGFELRTETNTLSYNNLSCRMAHLLFQGMYKYGGNLKQQMNFSMFLFSSREEDVQVMQRRYPNIPNVERIERLEYRNLAEDAIEENRVRIAVWFAHIIEEMELETKI